MRTLEQLGHGGACHHGPHAHKVARGKNPDGTWRTARTKQYTSKFCEIIAAGIIEFAEDLVQARGADWQQRLDPCFEQYLQYPVTGSEEVQADFVDDQC